MIFLSILNLFYILKDSKSSTRLKFSGNPSMLCCSSIRSVLDNVVAILDGGGVNKGGDLLVALSLLDHIDNVLKLVLLGDILGLGLSTA